jgi:hypothetical protein
MVSSSMKVVVTVMVSVRVIGTVKVLVPEVTTDEVTGQEVVVKVVVLVTWGAAAGEDSGALWCSKSPKAGPDKARRAANLLTISKK